MPVSEKYREYVGKKNDGRILICDDNLNKESCVALNLYSCMQL